MATAHRQGNPLLKRGGTFTPCGNPWPVFARLYRANAQQFGARPQPVDCDSSMSSVIHKCQPWLTSG